MTRLLLIASLIIGTWGTADAKPMPHHEQAPTPSPLGFVGSPAGREGLENCRVHYVHGSATVNADQQGRTGNRPSCGTPPQGSPQDGRGRDSRRDGISTNERSTVNEVGTNRDFLSDFIFGGMHRKRPLWERAESGDVARTAASGRSQVHGLHRAPAGRKSKLKRREVVHSADKGHRGAAQVQTHDSWPRPAVPSPAGAEEIWSLALKQCWDNWDKRNAILKAREDSKP